jgi:hypothetical protein
MFQRFIYSFPIQLFINSIRKNHLLLICWIVLFAIVTENLGKVLGVPNLFLDPEYIHETGFNSFLVMGICIAGFIMAYNITSYILDSQQFSFLGTLTHPFAKYCLNNSIIPAAFLIVYIIKVIHFQTENEYSSSWMLIEKLGGFLTGFLLMFAAWSIYFRFTNTDIFLLIAANLDKSLKKMPMNRNKALDRLEKARKHEYKVSSYLDLKLKFRKLDARQIMYDKQSILKVFDQNHLNSILTGLILILLTLVLGVFREYPIFQIPAGASVVLFMTIIILFSGSIVYWFRGWSTIITVCLVIALNLLAKTGLFHRHHKAYGLDYEIAPREYSLSSLEEQNNESNYRHDYMQTLKILKKWRAKFPEEQNPPMIFVCTSGGGQRSALWTMRVMQTADSLTGGRFMEHTTLITGASGGLIGAGFFRELKFRQKLGEKLNPYDPLYLQSISNDNLNPVIFTLIANDMFIRNQYFEFAGQKYVKDRGYAFERQLNKNTNFLMNRKLSEYQKPEQEALIPMMIISPTIINDGRKLYISSQHVSYMSSAPPAQGEFLQKKYKGIDFRRFFRKHGADSLHFLSALRMSATFPYVTPNVSLPSYPPIEIMDAGISDNFGISTAVHFLHTFKDWISANTSEVIFISIRDSQKNKPIEKELKNSFFHRIFTPIRSLYRNWANIQDLNNDLKLELAQSWFDGNIRRIELEYVPTTIFKEKDLPPDMHPDAQQKKKEIERASLSWHLTTREKENIKKNIFLPDNQFALEILQQALTPVLAEDIPNMSRVDFARKTTTD